MLKSKGETMPESKKETLTTLGHDEAVINYTQALDQDARERFRKRFGQLAYLDSTLLSEEGIFRKEVIDLLNFLEEHEEQIAIDIRDSFDIEIALITDIVHDYTLDKNNNKMLKEEFHFITDKGTFSFYHNNGKLDFIKHQERTIIINR